MRVSGRQCPRNCLHLLLWVVLQVTVLAASCAEGVSRIREQLGFAVVLLVIFGLIQSVDWQFGMVWI